MFVKLGNKIINTDNIACVQRGDGDCGGMIQLAGAAGLSITDEEFDFIDGVLRQDNLRHGEPIHCDLCRIEITGEPRDGWQVDDGKTVCSRCVNQFTTSSTNGELDAGRQDLMSKLFVEAEKTRQLVANLPKTGNETISRHAINRYENNAPFRNFVFAIRQVIRSSNRVLTVADVRMAYLVLDLEHGRYADLRLRPEQALGFIRNHRDAEAAGIKCGACGHEQQGHVEGCKVLANIRELLLEFPELCAAEGLVCPPVVKPAGKARTIQPESIKDIPPGWTVKQSAVEFVDPLLKDLGKLVTCDETGATPREIMGTYIADNKLWYQLEGGIKVPAERCVAYHNPDPVEGVDIDVDRIEVDTIAHSVNSVPVAGCSTCKGLPGGEHLYPCPHWRG